MRQREPAREWTKLGRGVASGDDDAPCAHAAVRRVHAYRARGGVHARGARLRVDTRAASHGGGPQPEAGAIRIELGMAASLDGAPSTHARPIPQRGRVEPAPAEAVLVPQPVVVAQAPF